MTKYFGRALKRLYVGERRAGDFVLYVRVYRPVNVFVGEFGSYVMPREMGVPQAYR